MSDEGSKNSIGPQKFSQITVGYSTTFRTTLRFFKSQRRASRDAASSLVYSQLSSNQLFTRRSLFTSSSPVTTRLLPEACLTTVKMSGLEGRKNSIGLQKFSQITVGSPTTFRTTLRFLKSQRRASRDAASSLAYSQLSSNQLFTCRSLFTSSSPVTSCLLPEACLLPALL